MHLLELLATLLGGGALTILARWGYDIWRTRHGFVSLLSSIDAVNESLKAIVDSTGASRALIVTGHNGGGVPRLGNHVNTSILYELTAKDEHAMKPGWQNIEVDRAQAQYLIDVFTKYESTITTDSLPVCNLHDAYVANDVDMAKLYFISQSKEQWYYLVVHYKSNDELTAVSRDVIREEVAKLKKLFKRGKA